MTNFSDAIGFYVGKSLVAMLLVRYLGTIVMSYTMFFREEICYLYGPINCSDLVM